MCYKLAGEMREDTDEPRSLAGQSEERITHDVSPRTIAISAPVEIRPRRERNREHAEEEE